VRRALLAGAAALLVAGALAVLWFYRSLDGIVERTLERVGSELLGTEVSVSSVHVELAAGRALVKGLEVANPRVAGVDFSGEPAIRLDSIDVTLDAGSVARGPIRLEEVRVAAPFVNLEVMPGDVNLLVLQRNVSRARPAEADAAAPVEEPRHFRVGSLSFAEGTLRADASAVGREVRDLRLPALRLTELGGREGATPGQLGQQVLEALLTRILAQAATDRVSELIEKELDQVEEKIGDALRSFLGADKKEE
jgi:hypothetical protein